MNPAIIAFVSILSTVQSTPVKPVEAGRCFTVRSLVQGSGTVKTFDHASDMGRVGVCK